MFILTRLPLPSAGPSQTGHATKNMTCPTPGRQDTERASSWTADVCQLPTVDDQEATQSQLRRQQAGSG